MVRRRHKILFDAHGWIGRRHFADTGAAGGGTPGGGQSGAGAGAGGAAGGGAAGAGAAGGGAGAPPPLAGADGALAENWLQHEKIDPSYRTSKTLAAIKTVPELVKWGMNLEQVLGKKRAVIPESDQDGAGLDAYFRAVGWPEKPDGYGAIKPLEGTPPELLPADEAGKAADQSLADYWLKICHEARLTPGQVQYLTKKVQEQTIATFRNDQADAVKRHEEARGALRTKWQAKYDFNVQLANTAAAAFADGPLLARLQAKGYLDDPDFLEYSAAVGAAVAPDRLHANSSGGTDKAGIERQIEELSASEPYRRPEHPRHEAVTRQVLQLREQLLNSR